MKSTSKISGKMRQDLIIQAARRIFVEKGFHGATTREIAAAAGVSEALLFKHFPSKDVLYSAMEMSCLASVIQENRKTIERLMDLEPSAATLTLLLEDFMTRLLGVRKPNDDERAFVRLILRSLMDEGDFARLALQGGPARWVRKVESCVRAAIAAGDAVEGPVNPRSAAWFIHLMVAMTMIYLLPEKPAIEWDLPRERLIDEAVWFALRGLGLKEEVIRRCCCSTMKMGDEKDAVRESFAASAGRRPAVSGK